MTETQDRVAILDLGKTNIKVVIATEDGTPVEILSFPNAPLTTRYYLAIDLPRIQELVLDALSELGKRHQIRAIVGTAHGCGGVALVTPNGHIEARAADDQVTLPQP